MSTMLLFLAAAWGADPDPGADALDAYLAERLDVVERDVSTVYAKGYDGSGRFWFVTRGGRQLTAVQFADALGDEEGSRTLRRRRTTAGAVGLSALVLGTAAGFYGTFDAVSFLDEPTPGQAAFTGGTLGVALVGIVGGTVVLARLPRSRHPSALYTEDEARTRAQARNAALRAAHLGEAEPEG